MAKEVRADLGKPVEPFIEKLQPEQRAIAGELHKLIVSAVPSIESGLKWGMPFYSKDGMVCFIMVAKKHINLGFAKGSSLKDPKKLLQAGTSKTMRALKVTSPKEIPAAAVKAFVKQAATLNKP
jgi:hypothetical protein